MADFLFSSFFADHASAQAHAFNPPANNEGSAHDPIAQAQVRDLFGRSLALAHEHEAPALPMPLQTLATSEPPLGEQTLRASTGTPARSEDLVAMVHHMLAGEPEPAKPVIIALETPDAPTFAEPINFNTSHASTAVDGVEEAPLEQKILADGSHPMGESPRKADQPSLDGWAPALPTASNSTTLNVPALDSAALDSTTLASAALAASSVLAPPPVPTLADAHDAAKPAPTIASSPRPPSSKVARTIGEASGDVKKATLAPARREHVDPQGIPPDSFLRASPLADAPIATAHDDVVTITAAKSQRTKPLPIGGASAEGDDKLAALVAHEVARGLNHPWHIPETVPGRRADSQASMVMAETTPVARAADRAICGTGNVMVAPPSSLGKDVRFARQTPTGQSASEPHSEPATDQRAPNAAGPELHQPEPAAASPLRPTPSIPPLKSARADEQSLPQSVLGTGSSTVMPRSKAAPAQPIAPAPVATVPHLLPESDPTKIRAADERIDLGHKGTTSPPIVEFPLSEPTNSASGQAPLDRRMASTTSQTAIKPAIEAHDFDAPVERKPSGESLPSISLHEQARQPLREEGVSHEQATPLAEDPKQLLETGSSAAEAAIAQVPSAPILARDPVIATPQAPTPPPPAAPPPALQAIEEALTTLRPIPEGGAVVTLHHEVYGKIDIQVRPEGGNLVLSIETQDERLRELLQDDRDGLAQALDIDKKHLSLEIATPFGHERERDSSGDGSHDRRRERQEETREMASESDARRGNQHEGQRQPAESAAQGSEVAASAQPQRSTLRSGPNPVGQTLSTVDAPHTTHVDALA